MSLTTCSRHPSEPAKGVCTRCGDFVCAACRGASPTGLCPECALRGPPAAATSGVPTIALVGAILCALLSGGFLLATSALIMSFAKGPLPLVAAWNGIMGLLYFWIAFELVKRTPRGYSWSLGTQRLNAILGGYYFFQNYTRPNAHWIILVLSGTSLAFHVTGWLCTKVAAPHFARRNV